MSGPAWFPWLIAGLFALSIAVHLRTREIRLYRAPEVWRHVKHSDDPGRFWLFVIAELIVMLAIVAEAVGFIN